MTRQGLRWRIGGIGIAVARCFTGRAARSPAPGRRHRQNRQRRHRRRGHGPARARGGRLGDRGNQGPAHSPDQDRRHRRSGPLPRARPSESELRRVGPRLRTRGFTEGQGGAGQAAEPDGRGGAEPARRRRNTIPRSIGSRCFSCRPRATSPAPAPKATAFRKTSRARASGFATSSTRTAAPAAINWATRRRARSPRASASSRPRSRRGIGGFSRGRPAADERPVHPGWPGARAGDVRGLDRSDCRRRAAGRRRRPPAGQRAERRRHDVGLGRSQGVSPR